MIKRPRMMTRSQRKMKAAQNNDSKVVKTIKMPDNSSPSLKESPSKDTQISEFDANTNGSFNNTTQISLFSTSNCESVSAPTVKDTNICRNHKDRIITDFSSISSKTKLLVQKIKGGKSSNSLNKTGKFIKGLSMSLGVKELTK